MNEFCFSDPDLQHVDESRYIKDSGNSRLPPISDVDYYNCRELADGNYEHPSDCKYKDSLI